MSSITVQCLCNCKNRTLIVSSTLVSSSSSCFSVTHKPRLVQRRQPLELKEMKIGRRRRRGEGIVCGGVLPVDPWSPSIDSQSIASQLFAVSLLPYIGFLYFITKSNSSPKLTLFGFYFLLAFVGATIPAGIYAKVQYGTSLSNVDWLHGGAESLLTLTNLFIVLGLRQALRTSKHQENKNDNNQPST